MANQLVSIRANPLQAADQPNLSLDRFIGGVRAPFGGPATQIWYSYGQPGARRYREERDGTMECLAAERSQGPNAGSFGRRPQGDSSSRESSLWRRFYRRRSDG